MQRFTGALIISVVLAVLGYATAIMWSGSEETWQAAGKLGLPLWGLVLLLSLCNYLIRFVRWEMYLSHLGTPFIPRFEHLKIYFSGFALTTTPGKVGEAIRSVYLKPHGVGYRESISALFVERLMDLFSVAFIALFAVSYFDNPMYTTVAWVCGGALLLLMPLIHNQKLWRWISLKSSDIHSKLGVLVHKFTELIESSASLLRNKLLYSGFALAVLAWGMEGLGLYFILQALGVEVSPMIAIGIYSISVLIGALSFVPGGLGSTEAVMGLLLIAVGTDKSSAVAATLICRLATLWFAVVLGMGALLSVTRGNFHKIASAKQE